MFRNSGMVKGHCTLFNESDENLGLREIRHAFGNTTLFIAQGTFLTQGGT
jgi:hypothetical protein